VLGASTSRSRCLWMKLFPTLRDVEAAGVGGGSAQPRPTNGHPLLAITVMNQHIGVERQASGHVGLRASPDRLGVPSRGSGIFAAVGPAGHAGDHAIRHRGRGIADIDLGPTAMSYMRPVEIGGPWSTPVMGVFWCRSVGRVRTAAAACAEIEPLFDDATRRAGSGPS